MLLSTPASPEEKVAEAEALVRHFQTEERADRGEGFDSTLTSREPPVTAEAAGFALSEFQPRARPGARCACLT